MKAIYSSYANNYYSKGLHVIPVKNKIPVFEKWTQYNNTPPSIADYNSWLASYPGLGIGLLTGKASGIIAVDIDSMAYKHLIPDSPVTKFGKRGETRFFKYNKERARKFRHLEIEILSDGNQTVMPPSPHPKGGSYTWLKGNLNDLNKETLPELSPKVIDELDRLDQKLKTEAPKSSGKTMAGEGRHNTLISMCGGKLSDNKPKDLIVDELIEYDLDHHEPPYFTDKSETHGGTGVLAAEKMFESLKSKRLRDGDEYEPMEWAGYSDDIKFTTPYKGGEQDSNKHEGSDEHSSGCKDSGQCEINSEKEVSALNIFELPKPLYYMKDIYEHVKSICRIERDSFCLASSLSLVSVLAAHKFRYRDNYPILYSLLVCPSGGGKDAPLFYPHTVLNLLGASDLAGYLEYRSDRAMIESLEWCPNRLDALDEVSRLFKSANSKNASSFSSALPELCSTLWSFGARFYSGQTAGGDTKGFCHTPSVNMIAATTPDSFSKTFSVDNVQQGFGGRFLYFVDTEKKRQRPYDEVANFEDCPFPKKAWQFLKALASLETNTTEFNVTGKKIYRKDPETKKSVLVESVKAPVIRSIKMTAEASDELSKAQDLFQDLSEQVGENMAPLVARGFEYTKRIMVSAWLSRAMHQMNEEEGLFEPGTSEIDRLGWEERIAKEYPLSSEDVLWSRDVAGSCLKNAECFFDSYLIESQHHAYVEKMKRVFEKRPGKVLEMSQLSGLCTRWSDSKLRRKLVRELEELQVIEKSGIGYMLKE